MILGGRFLLSHSLTGPQGLQTEGYSIMGYDREKARYTTISIDTKSTKINYWEGVREDGGRIVLKDPFGVTELVMTVSDDGTGKTSLMISYGQDAFEFFRSESKRVEPEGREEGE